MYLFIISCEKCMCSTSGHMPTPTFRPDGIVMKKGSLHIWIPWVDPTPRLPQSKPTNGPPGLSSQSCKK